MSYQLSVVIPVYNREKQLKASVNSVLQQNIAVEIILVDDASTDQSANVIKELASQHPNIVYKILEQNKGGGFARNVGIDLASSKWVAFLDSDDEWLPTKINRQLDVLNRVDHDSVLCFTNLLVDVHDGSQPSPWNSLPFSAQDSAKNFILKKHQVIQTSTIVMSAKAAKNVRFNDHLRRHQDIDFVLRCEQAGVAFIYLDEYLVRYSADPKQNRVSKRVNARPSLAWLEVAREYLTTEEIDAFYLYQVFDMHFKDEPLGALQRGLSAASRGQESYPKFCKRVIKQLIPQFIKKIYHAL